jgi:cytoskeletal protein CcmA (bactofilin family)
MSIPARQPVSDDRFAPPAHSTLGKTLHIKGEIRAGEDLTIEGHVDGPIFAEHAAVIVSASADVHGDLVARDITVFGRSTGQLVATDVVDIRAEAEVRGHVVSPRLILDPAALFTGRVEPQHLDAAVRVAKFQQRQRDGA